MPIVHVVTRGMPVRRNIGMRMSKFEEGLKGKNPKSQIRNLKEAPKVKSQTLAVPADWCLRFVISLGFRI